MDVFLGLENKKRNLAANSKKGQAKKDAQGPLDTKKAA